MQITCKLGMEPIGIQTVHTTEVSDKRSIVPSQYTIDAKQHILSTLIGIGPNLYFELKNETIEQLYDIKSIKITVIVMNVTGYDETESSCKPVLNTYENEFYTINDLCLYLSNRTTMLAEIKNDEPNMSLEIGEAVMLRMIPGNTTMHITFDKFMKYYKIIE